MLALQPHYDAFLKTLPPPPVERRKLDELVLELLEQTRNKVFPENLRVQWEYVLRNDILTLASTEGNAIKERNTKYYDILCSKLDLALTFTEQNACEQTFPFNVLQDLLETQTIASCSHIFSWIERHAGRLTQGMVPQKGKALVLLRTLNDLLRRLSRMGNTTIFCGRILTFLSGVFPLGERSGVNLRGDYGPTWEGVKFPEREKSTDKDKEDAMKVDEVPPTPGSSQDSRKNDDKMDVDVKKSGTKPADAKADFYNTFWSLQLPFSKPPVFATKGAFEEFKEGVLKILPVIKEATAKERAMMGSRNGTGSATLKRKRDSEEETNTNEYFFAKFLTSPELLDLEIADTHFRRQFLLQLLILLHHLQSFTKAAKAVWPTPRNRSLHMEFTLEEEDAQWVSDMTNKVLEELRQTTPNGRIFAETVNVILERDKNWVKWKNELCTAFDKEPWATDVDGEKLGLFEATKPTRDKMHQPPEDWKWTLGTEPLTEIWDMGYTSLVDLQMPFHPGDVKDFVKKIKLEDSRIAMRRQRLEKIAKARAAAAAAAARRPTPTPTPAPSVVVSSELTSKPEPVDPSQPPLASPRPVSAANMLHPSLPPKPSTPGKPNQEPPKPVPSPNASARTPSATPAPPSAPHAAVVPSPTPAPPPVVDEEIAKYEDNKQRWSWLALRTARDQYLQHFGKIGTGDVELLAQEIEKEKAQGAKNEEPMGSQGGDENTQTGTPPPATGTKEGEMDVKMEAT